jgi:hypothetical protein
VTDSIPVAENLAILVGIAALAGTFVLVLLNTLWRIERRARWSREAGIRSKRLERRVFRIGVGVVLVMAALVLLGLLLHRPSCTGRIVAMKDSAGTPMMCVCEQGRRGVCFPSGP